LSIFVTSQRKIGVVGNSCGYYRGGFQGIAQFKKFLETNLRPAGKNIMGQILVGGEKFIALLS
jgi:hypothetical protein